MERIKTIAPLKDDLPCIACTPRLCSFVHALKQDVSPHHVGMQRGERLECFTGSCMKFWTVVRGTAAICTMLRDGRRQIIALSGAGSVVCGLLADGNTPHWLEALEPSEICEIDFTPLAAELARDAAFMRTMTDMMHDQLIQTSQHLVTLGRLDSTERVIFFLGRLAIHSARQPNSGPAVHLPMSREDIADYLGLNAETVSRILTKLRKSGLITFLNRSEYVVPDMTKLERRLPLPLQQGNSQVMGQFAEGKPDDTMVQA